MATENEKLVAINCNTAINAANRSGNEANKTQARAYTAIAYAILDLARAIEKLAPEKNDVK